MLTLLGVQNQWTRTKQTKEEAAAARRGKLDPDSELNRNAKEVMDERARTKRKLQELEMDDESIQDEEEVGPQFDGVQAEAPLEGLKTKTENTSKKPKLQEDHDDRDEQTSSLIKMSKKEEKKMGKREKKKEKREEKRAQKAAVGGHGEESQSNDNPATTISDGTSEDNTNQKAGVSETTRSEEVPSKTARSLPKTKDVTKAKDASTEPATEQDSITNSSDASEPASPTFDTEPATKPYTDAVNEPVSTTTSISSTIPPSEKPKHIKLPADTSNLRARLAAKIEALRAARKADGTNGRPIRTRQELIEARRSKEADRKAHKKELRQQAKLEEDRKREEALASNSPGITSPAVELDEAQSNFTFGRVAFGDGAQLSRDLSYVLQSKKKGPSDLKTNLIKVQNQKKRLQELDEDKQKDIAEKESWLVARRRAEGEKVRDDEATLKKAIKRKETAKKKSEKAWKDRTSGVMLAQKERQKKREENLKKRKDDKLLGKAGKKKKKSSGGGGKKKGRPGFEGSLGVGGRKK